MTRPRPMSAAELAEVAHGTRWSTRELGDMLGVSHTTIQRWMNGQRPIPDAVAEWLREVAAWLNSHPPPPPPPNW